jgi:hypothetical protein
MNIPHLHKFSPFLAKLSLAYIGKKIKKKCAGAKLNNEGPNPMKL